MTEQLVQRGLRDGSATQAGNRGVAFESHSCHRHAHVGGDNPAHADREAFFQHQEAFAVNQCAAHLFERERAVADDAEYADLVALTAHLVDRVLDGTEHRAHRDDDGFGVIRTIGADKPAAVATEYLTELGGQLRNPFNRLHLFGMCKILYFHEGFRSHHRTDGDRFGRIEHLARLERRQVGIDLFL